MTKKRATSFVYEVALELFNMNLGNSVLLRAEVEVVTACLHKV